MNINLNGELRPAGEPIFGHDNRSFRYGDGLFESIRMADGKMPFWPLHFERLKKGAELFKFKWPKNWTAEYFEEQITTLLKADKHSKNARVRLTIFRGSGGFYEPTSSKAEYLIEAMPLKSAVAKGDLSLDVFTEMEKPVSVYSTVKSNSSLLYVMASIQRKELKVDDLVVTNTKNRVIETIESNIFLIRDGIVLTPPTTEGCVAGVMRQHLFGVFDRLGISFKKIPLNLEDLFTADAIFLTNAIQGIQWVKNYKSKEFEPSELRERLAGV